MREANPPAEAAPPVLEGRFVRLRPITPEDYGFLFALCTHPEVAFRWRFGGVAGDPESFIRELWRGSYTQLLVERPTDDPEPLGMVSCFNADLVNRHAHISIALRPNAQGTRAAGEAMSLFVDHLFAAADFRKVYAESVEFNYEQFSSGAGKYFEVEGRLIEDQYYDGRYWDTIVLAIHRAAWDASRAERARLLGRR